MAEILTIIRWYNLWDGDSSYLCVHTELSTRSS